MAACTGPRVTGHLWRSIRYIMKETAEVNVYKESAVLTTLLMCIWWRGSYTNALYQIWMFVQLWVVQLHLSKHQAESSYCQRLWGCWAAWCLKSEPLSSAMAPDHRCSIMRGCYITYMQRQCRTLHYAQQSDSDGQSVCKRAQQILHYSMVQKNGKLAQPRERATNTKPLWQQCQRKPDHISL